MNINRNILFQKLSYYGIKDKELKRSSLYLTRRRQITKVNDVESSMRENDFSVSRCVRLGCLLFIIYINDIENVIGKCEIVLYADDTLIFTKYTTCEECYDKIEKDMDNINRCLTTNELKLNEKTKLMKINIHTNK